MKKLLSTIKKVFAAQNSYFSECGQEIAIRNLELMCTLCCAGIIMYALYFLVTQLFFPQWGISAVYSVFVPMLLGFYLYAHSRLRGGAVRAAPAMTATTLMYAGIMLNVIALSVFPHPNVPSVYFPLFLIMGPVTFILPVRRQLAVTLGGFTLFYVLVLKFKNPVCWSHELFEAFTALFLALIVIILMMQLRVQSDSLKTKYYDLSRLDGLTGVLNKSAGLAAADHYLAAMGPEERCAVLFVDIDDFKALNDTHGHIEGDRWLMAIGGALQALCRKDDIVFRFGGDEFVVLLKDLPGGDTAEQKARRFSDSIAELSGPRLSKVTCSVGICYAGRGGGSIAELAAKADASLYDAKKRGKDSYAIYTD